MSGYTPLFSSLTTGTLCGRWPDIGLWPIVLSMSDKHGVVDVTPAYISGVTGLPLADVVACMKRFCEPDPYSRSPADAGARLALIDEHRDWGWKIINHGIYREKARKQMQQIEFTQSGRDAERKRIERERASSSGVQSSPAVSGAVRPSDSDSDSDSEKTKIGQSDFDRFWIAYPKKVKRKTSAEIWSRKRLDSKTGELIADVQRRLESDRRWREGFIPDPTTYLNQERWGDELDVVKRPRIEGL